jgi:hypothetical protein
LKGEAVENSSARKSDTKKPVADRDDDATSKETVKDLEETTTEDHSGTEQDSGPSPDGSLDESDEIESADPM